MQTTSISWATYSWNPVTGCTWAGPECDHCYAETFTKRQAGWDNGPAYATDEDWQAPNAQSVVTVHDGTPTTVYDDGDQLVETTNRLREPYEYHYPEGPGVVFVVSMGDLFHSVVPDSFIAEVVDVARDFPEHIWAFLTKRPRRAASLDLDWPANAWVGTSVGSGPGGEYSDTTARIDHIREVDAETCWVSFEPLLEPVGDVVLTGIDWAVVGGESAPDDVRRDMKHEWAADIYQQCTAAGTAFFFKQSSGRQPDTGRELRLPTEYGLSEQMKIEQYPDLPDVTRVARVRRQAEDAVQRGESGTIR